MTDSESVVPFSPISVLHLEKKLSEVEYEQRRNETTTTELNHLLNSEDFKKWTKRTHPKPHFGIVEIGLGILFLGLLGGLVYNGLKPGIQRIAEPALQADEALLAAKEQEILAAQGAAKQLAENLRVKEEAKRLSEERVAQQQELLLSTEAKLRQRTEELQKQTEELGDLQHRLKHPPADEYDNTSQVILPSNGTLLDKLLQGLDLRSAALIAGIPGFLAIASLLIYKLRVRRRIAAARQEALHLQEMLLEASRAKAYAEEQVLSVRTSMAAKTEALKAAQIDKHQAEEQVRDLQKRYMHLQQLHADPDSEERHEEDTQNEKEELIEELHRLQETVNERDADLLGLNQELSNLAERLPREIQERETAVRQVRLWLDQAQGQLQQTQAELSDKEKECRQLKERLEDQTYSDSALKEALEAAKLREEDLRIECQNMVGEQKARVASIMDLMKSQRLTLSHKLMQSQQYIAELVSALDAMKNGETRFTSKQEDIDIKAIFTPQSVKHTPQSKKKHKGENARLTKPVGTPPSSASKEPSYSRKPMLSPLSPNNL